MNKAFLESIANQNGSLVESDPSRTPVTISSRYGSVAMEQTLIDGKTSVTFEMMRTDECAITYIENNMSKNVVVMNFASRHNHGGGYVRGAKAQEEDLCRVMPYLYESLCKVRYPYEEDTVLITPNVEIMRDSNNRYTLFRGKDVHTVSVVSAAAPNLRRERFNEDRVRRTLINLYCSVSKNLPDTDTLILGAWGCGAYGNDPNQMAMIMNDINLKYGGRFKRVVFAIPRGINVEEFKSNIQLFN